MASTRRCSSTFGIVIMLGAASAGCAAELPAPPAPAAPPQATAASAPAEKSTADIVATALPSLVLLINERPAQNAKPAYTTYGAGFLTRDGLVVTSLHVVDGDGKLSAMLYEPNRQGYTPMDGGLARFLFENQKNLVPAERIAADGVSDLAVVRVSADTSHLPKLVWSETELRAGDRVLALGHPQETVWSFSAGVVGALQHGIVQHDAVVGPGSSGGPLLNTRGEVVGVNVARVMNQPDGLSFARPIAMVASTFSDKKVVSPLDQSTPETAAVSCWRAQQLALPETADCFDWEAHWARFQAVAEEARRLATSDTARAKIDRCFLSADTKSRWLAMEREDVIHIFDPGYGGGKLQKHSTEPEADEKKAAPAEGFLADFRDPQRLAKRLRNGLRVEGTHTVSADMAWVLLASRAADSSVDRFTELYVRVQGRWVQRYVPNTEEVQALPDGWPAPPMSWSEKRPKQISWILKKAGSTDACPFGTAESDAASSPGGSGRAVLRAGY
ncbi:MAG: serine protease [Polyangiaceae bacterium]